MATSRLTPEESLYVALDCEMVGIGPRSTSVLAEVVLVDWNGNTIYHSYVTPPAPVTNYRYEVSGIHANVLETKGRPFHIVQAEVEKLIRYKVVVGHGLANDFKYLGLRHPSSMTRDTTQHTFFMRPNPKSTGMNPQKLSTLAREYLGKEIQMGKHDPAEDARTAMELFRKFKNLWSAPKKTFAATVAASTKGGTRRHRAASRNRKTRRSYH